jgi:hypothetical protein
MFIYTSQNFSPSVCVLQNSEKNLFHLLAFLLKIIFFCSQNITEYQHSQTESMVAVTKKKMPEL